MWYLPAISFAWLVPKFCRSHLSNISLGYYTSGHSLGICQKNTDIYLVYDMSCFTYQVYDIYIYIAIWPQFRDLYWSYFRYICIMAVTRRLMLQLRTQPHSSCSASNHIAWSYQESDSGLGFLHSWLQSDTTFASSRFNHVHMMRISSLLCCWRMLAFLVLHSQNKLEHTASP